MKTNKKKNQRLSGKNKRLETTLEKKIRECNNKQDVITNQNKLIGKIIEINNFGAGDLLNVRNLKGQTFYIPMNGENIIKVDLKKKLVVSNPLKGILN